MELARIMKWKDKILKSESSRVSVLLWMTMASLLLALITGFLLGLLTGLAGGFKTQLILILATGLCLALLFIVLKRLWSAIKRFMDQIEKEEGRF